MQIDEKIDQQKIAIFFERKVLKERLKSETERDRRMSEDGSFKSFGVIIEKAPSPNRED